MAEAETGTPEAVEPLEDLASRLAAAEARVKECQDQYLRSLAEIDNVRKRAQRDIEAANRYGLERFAQELLPVKEGLDLAVENAGKADRDSLAAGQLATRDLLSKAFERLGISEVNPLGEPFDPTRHEAMMVQPSETAEPDTVLTVVQRGYVLNGRLLRPARVIVAKAADAAKAAGGA
ncbi:MAG: Protein GrpE [Steroidobacteraceae bacterium]|nr:Protein GrpE [Steroidobacteraceae bacterium]